MRGQLHCDDPWAPAAPPVGALLAAARVHLDTRAGGPFANYARSNDTSRAAHGGRASVTSIAFRMQLKAGAAQEYRRRHDAIWPELVSVLRDAGIYDYSIFLDPESSQLFAVLKLAPHERRDSLADHPVMRRWWAYMADLMETDASQRPKEWPLEPMFHMD